MSGQQTRHTEIYLGAKCKAKVIPKVKIEIVVESSQIKSVVAAIIQHTKTGQIGDGKIFILPIEEVVRI